MAWPCRVSTTSPRRVGGAASAVDEDPEAVAQRATLVQQLQQAARPADAPGAPQEAAPDTLPNPPAGGRRWHLSAIFGAGAFKAEPLRRLIARYVDHALLERIGLADRAHERARNLSYGEQRRVEIARALAADPRLLLLDEPTAGMNPVEVQAVATLIRKVAAEGHAVLLIEHNVKLVMDVCDRITVLDFGKVIAEGAPAEVARDPAVIAAYLGSGA